uniref:Uncharacterized protein n=1 Tax=Cynoglossus semilaevis TaxID=244447 RepID=A0A3P8VY07_CYNSE
MQSGFIYWCDFSSTVAAQNGVRRIKPDGSGLRGIVTSGIGRNGIRGIPFSVFVPTLTLVSTASLVRTCNSDQFRCDDGRCIAPSWICDGDNDCGDMSDEDQRHNCGMQPYFTCIKRLHVCDRRNDCGDSSDEQSCTYQPCQQHQFTCQNGRCVSHDFVCDGDNDCGDESDELEHRCHTPAPTCPPGEFRCDNGHCIALSQVVTVRTIVETSQTRTLHTALPGPVALDSSNAVMAVASLRTGNVTWMMTVVTTLMNRWRSAVSGICIFIVYFNHLEICFIRSLSQSIFLLMNPFVWTTVGPAFRCDNHTEFDCKTNYRCVPLWSVCNGQNDCRDNSDEQGCGECWLKKKPDH